MIERYVMRATHAIVCYSTVMGDIACAPHGIG
jgi:hypothetical protein